MNVKIVFILVIKQPQ